MAELFPNSIDRDDPRRNGERLVFDWFSKDEIKGTVYYSLRQKNHRYKLSSEIDFLYICERGILCIEVKGGQNIYRQDRTWYSENRNGETFQIHNPFEQALGCQYALKKYLSDIYGKHSKQANYLIGYAVIFPECIFTGEGNDLVTEVVFDGKNNIYEFGKYLDSVFDYWTEQEKTKHHFSPEKLNIQQLKQLNDLLRGDFRVVPSMHLELQSIEERMLQLTDEQYDVIETVQENERALIQGTAGTGKSLLALELVRKSAAKEKNVLYLCFNRNMARYASASLEKSEYINVSTFHTLMKKYFEDEEVYNYSVKELCNKSSLQCFDETEKYDVVVVDEGQDLFCVEVFDVLEYIVKNGLSTGSWYMFFDPNQNIFGKIDDFETTFELLKESYKPAILNLRINCRNTEQIARRTSLLTNTPPAKYLKVNGLKVENKKYETKQEFIKELRKTIMSLISSGVESKDIVIISTLKKSNSLLANIDEICNYKIIENSNINKFDKKCINYYTVFIFF